MELTNKTILLSGASGGIGAAIARTFSEKGSRLLLVGRDENRLLALKQSLSGDQNKHQMILADITTVNGRQQVLDVCRQEGVDLLINAAGILDFQMLENQNPDRVEQTIATNLLAPMLLCQALIGELQQRNEAAIINIGSIFGSIGHPGFATYCASKSGLKGFTEALRRELADSEIKVFYLAPRATETALNSEAVTALNQALGNKVDPPQYVADELIKLLSNGRQQAFMGWPEKLFVTINAIFPGIVHSALVKKLPIVKRFARQQS